MGEHRGAHVEYETDQGEAGHGLLFIMYPDALTNRDGYDADVYYWDGSISSRAILAVDVTDENAEF